MSNQIKFKRTLFGVKKKNVVEYINSVSKNIEDKLFKKDSEIAKLKKDIDLLNAQKALLEKEIADFEEEKNKISEVFFKAEESAKAIIKKAEEEAENKLKETDIKVSETYEQLERNKERINSEFEAKISGKKAELNNYKTEINFLREKIKVTLNKFDEILENATK